MVVIVRMALTTHGHIARLNWSAGKDTGMDIVIRNVTMKNVYMTDGIV